MSYNKCVYHNCYRTSRDISMFRFPVHDPDRVTIWIRNSGNIYLDCLTTEELKSRYICATHFPSSNIHHGAMRSRLLGPAVPHCYLSHDFEGVSDGLSSPEVLKVKTPTKFYGRRREMKSNIATKMSTPSSVFSDFGEHKDTPTGRKRDFSGQQSRKFSRKRLFENCRNDSPKTKNLKHSASSLLKKNIALKAQIRRLRKRTLISSETISINPEKFQSQTSKTLTLMQLRNKKGKWSKDEKNLCMSLFYKSSSNYVFMRRQGIVLAAPSTIRTWLSKTNCSPGLCKDIFEQLKKKFENASFKSKACIVCFDEMAIMQNLEYSKKFDIIEGFEDLGKNKRTDKMAKYALVFVVRGLYDNWKIPVAYFLSHSNVKADNLQLLVKAVINKLFDNGLLPKAVVCDQMSTNQKIFKSFGVTSKFPFFFCRERKIFAIFDVPHLIKNIRNNFLNNNLIYEDVEVSFQDVIKTFEIDKLSTKSRSLTKINERHIAPNNFQKMNVKLAAQIFSNSVSAAIKTAHSSGELKSETANNTAKFIQIVNNLFDALNSKAKYAKNASVCTSVCALSNSSDFARKAIKDGQHLFTEIKKISLKKDKNGLLTKNLTRPPCFEGIVQSSEVILQLYREESTDPQISFLMTYKLNQDVIENLFARFRQQGGCNRNPTAKLLRTIFRSNIINSLCKISTKNCLDDEDIFIETNEECTRSQSPPSEETAIALEGDADVEKHSEQSTTRKSSNTVEYDLCRADSFAVASTSSSGQDSFQAMTKLEDCSVAYFAGYLAKCCIDKFKCETCVNNFIKKDAYLNDEKQLLILNKSYSCKKNIGLKMPSDKLFQLVYLALEGFNIHFENVHQNNIKFNLLKSVQNYVICETDCYDNTPCAEHVRYLLDHMLFVKLNFYCKSKKSNFVENKMNANYAY